MSNVSGDNLRVDKNGLSQLKHFGHSFFVIYNLCPGRTTPARITLSGREPEACAELTTWSHRGFHDHHTAERGKWDFIVQGYLASFAKRLVSVCIAWTAGYMAATYEPIYGLSEDEVNFNLNNALLCGPLSNNVSFRGINWR